MTDVFDQIMARAAELDAADELAPFVDRFVDAGRADDGTDVIAYLDGNSLGRPLKATREALDAFVAGPWGTRLIRGWTDEWMTWPETSGDLVARACLGAADGQTIVGDSTTVLLYKAARAVLDHQMAADPDRRVVVTDTDNFPTDRYVLEGIVDERGGELRWVGTDPASGITVEQVREACAPGDVALVLLSHVAYRSGHLAAMEEITRVAHEAGALVVWDLSHTVGSVPVQLDAWAVDIAVGCSYKYLNGGPGAPAWIYVARRHHDTLRQPLQGWMGHADPFLMGPGYTPAPGIRGWVTGTPPVLGMLPVRLGAELVAEAGIDRIRAKSIALTEFALECLAAWPQSHDVEVASPQDPEQRGGHVTLRRDDFREVCDDLWERGVIPDFRTPDGIRLGLSPLSTTFTEVARAMTVLHEVLLERRGRA